MIISHPKCIQCFIVTVQCGVTVSDIVTLTLALTLTLTLTDIYKGTIFGELGLLSRGHHSRTIIASADSRIAMLSRDNLDEIEDTDKVTHNSVLTIAMIT